MEAQLNGPRIVDGRAISKIASSYWGIHSPDFVSKLDNFHFLLMGKVNESYMFIEFRYSIANTDWGNISTLHKG